ncbi:MAG TPA: molybdenum cofactor biosynthesis protein MoaE [Thermoanaerobaculia bacterium]|jgi:molybdopterin synthase catalytic subunit|nr:molybdenum cofactor biosynthesis protein MoaE [Thermoanaerobaculia bacterium]
MRIRLLAFASANDALGTGELELELPEAARVDDLRAWLDARYPALAPLWPRLAVAVDGTIARSDQILGEGAEVALLPPVSGGSGGGPAVAAVPPVPPMPPTPPLPLNVELVDAPIDPRDVISRVASPACGAVLLFLGTVRDHSHRRDEATGAVAAVLKLTYTAYRPMARQALERIVAELERATEGLRLAIVHRLGEVPVGEPSVAIAAAARHRAAAYEASRQALERLKSEVPIWKLEHYADGRAAWREEEPLNLGRAQV